jgi:hypothetical protein
VAGGLDGRGCAGVGWLAGERPWSCSTAAGLAPTG